jgi:hypothetical protein
VKVKLGPADDRPLTIALTEAGVEYTVAPGDHLVYEWPDYDEFPRPMPTFGVGTGGTLVVRWTRGRDRLWASDGRHLPVHPQLGAPNGYDEPWCVGCCLPREDLDLVVPPDFDRRGTLESEVPCPFCGASEVEWAEEPSDNG